MFQGYLIKFGNVVLPNSFLLADGYEDTPNQRLELSAYRDANAYLHRETSANTKTSLQLNIRSLNLTEMTAFKNVIGLASLPETSKIQRRVTVTYWNDEDLDYKTTVFYISDIKYTVHRIDEATNNIEYNEFNVQLTEY